MIKVVFVDIDNTLLDFDEGARQSMMECFDLFGLEYEDRMFDQFQAVNDQLWSSLERGELTRERLHQIRWNLIFDRLGIVADGERFEHCFFERLKTSAVPIEGAAELMKYLSGRYIVCVASNASHDQQSARLQKAGMAQYVDKYFVSCTLGADKPSKQFFDRCFEQLPGVSVDEAIIVGDSLSADMRGGKDYGIATCWYNPGLKPPVDWVDYTVTTLGEVKNIL